MIRDDSFSHFALNKIKVKTTSNEQTHELPTIPPFIWPEARFHSGVASYTALPPTLSLWADAKLISGLLIGAADGAVRWLTELVNKKVKRHICLVLIVSPASPTRREHLEAITRLQATCDGSDVILDVRLLPMDRLTDTDYEVAVLPPSVIQAHSPSTGNTVMSVGSIGDAGYDKVFPGSLNFVFHPDDALRDAWRRWFQYALDCAAPLSQHTIDNE